MKKIILTMMAITCGLCALAEVQVVGRKSVLNQGQTGYNPVLSADGSKLLYSASDYSNLQCLDLASGTTTLVSDDAMAGFSPVFSKDGKSVYYMSQTLENRLVYRSMKSCDLSDMRTATVIEKTRGLSRPVAVESGVVANSQSGKLLKAKKKAVNFVVAKGNTLIVSTNGVEKQLQPVATDYTYMWESLSPDGTKILFYAGGKGAFVCDLEGNVLNRLGKITCPQWLDDNNVVAERSTDDGYQFETSQIVAVDLGNGAITELTKPESMTMNPSVAVKSCQVAYNTIDGRLFVMNLRIK